MPSQGRKQKVSDKKELSPFAFGRVHPYKLMLLFALIGLSLLFVGISLAYLLNYDNSSWSLVAFPPFFILSTFFILISSLTMEKAMQSFKHEDYRLYRKWLVITTAFGVLFCISQLVGWMELSQNGIELGSNMPNSYLYIISGLHLVHILVGLAILSFYSYFAIKRTLNPLIAIVHFTDPRQKLNLDLIRIYWHFVDLLWLYLIAFFLFNKVIY